MEWTSHNKMVGTISLPPAQTLLETLRIMEAKGEPPATALDLGSGAGIDTAALLERGWLVTAIDHDPKAIEQLQAQYSGWPLVCIHTDFVTMKPGIYQLVNATFSLPFCGPDHFAACWAKVIDAVVPGGYFCGHFFGSRDSWKNRPDVITHSAESVAALFSGFDLLWQREIEKDMPALGGKLKHWHIHAVCARKHP
jgi:SAM-dependent methyltransferase